MHYEDRAFNYSATIQDRHVKNWGKPRATRIVNWCAVIWQLRHSAGRTRRCYFQQASQPATSRYVPNAVGTTDMTSTVSNTGHYHGGTDADKG